MARRLSLGAFSLFGLGPLVLLALGEWRTLAWPGAMVWSACLGSLTVAAASTALALPLGLAVAWLEVQAPSTPLRWASRLWRTTAAIPPVLLAMAALDAFSPRAGVFWHGHTIELASLGGIIVLLALTALPWVLSPLCNALARVDPALEEAARLSGASRLRVFGDVTWPLVKDEVGATARVVFATSLAAFGIPYLLGSLAQTRPALLSTEIVFALQGLSQAALGQALSFVVPLVVLSLALTAIRRHGPQSDSVRPALRRPEHTTATRVVGLCLCGLAVVSVLLPLVALGLRATAADPTRPWAARTAAAFTGLWHEPGSLAIVGRSLAVASISSALIVGLALSILLLSTAATRRRYEAIARMLYEIPGSVLAIAWIYLASLQPRLIIADHLTIALALSDTLALFICAYVAKYMFVALAALGAALDRTPQSWVDAARLSGAKPLRAQIDIRAKLALPTVLSTTWTLFLTLLPELTIAVLLFGPHTTTLGTHLFELATYTDPRQASAIATLLCAAAILGDWLRGATQSRNTPQA